MKVLLFLITLTFFFGSTPSFGQNQSQFDAKINHLHQLIEAIPSDNAQKVELLNELARLYFYSYQPLEGFRTTKQALEISERINFIGGKVMYYLTLSVYHREENEDMFIYYRKKAEWLSKSYSSQTDNNFVYPQIPELNARTDFEDQRKTYQSILTFFQQPEDEEIRANLYFKLGYIHSILGNLEKSIQISDTIRSIYNDLNQVYPVFLCTIYKMDLLHTLGNTEASKQAEIELIQLFLESKNENSIGLIAATMASGYADNGRYTLSIEYYLKSIEIFEKLDDFEILFRQYWELGVAYENIGMNSKAVDSYKTCIDLLDKIEDKSRFNFIYSTIPFSLIAIEEYDQALYYMNIAQEDSINMNNPFIQARLLDARGQLLMSKDQFQEALGYFHKSLVRFEESEQGVWAIPFIYSYIAQCEFELGNLEEASKYGQLSLEFINEGERRVNRRANLLLSMIYEEMGNESLALKHLKKYKDIVELSDKNAELSRIADAEVQSILDRSQNEILELEQQQLLINQENKIQRLWLFFAALALVFALLMLYILFLNNRNKQRINAELQEQKDKVELTLQKLKSTQNQLVHVEKMASLGELTAGIAHEIQNPLNFVNNFSEVSGELLNELIDEIEKGDMEEVKIISADLLHNLTKITHHGKRADGIVKGMLAHSRSSAGHKVPTNINQIAEEYLRLSFHGLRAKDKSFNADFKAELDPNLPKIKVITQDISRVLLNLINNAFQAVAGTEKARVTVTTKKNQDKVEILISDNGSGIPESIIDKIFLPFFTTKPSGQGTGLGLSISYDIIQAHGGSLKVESTEGNGTTFTIELPIT